jgi:hypothetical protein
MMPPRSLFREEAMLRHKQKQEKDVLPRFISPPVFLCFWLLFVLFLAAAGLVWWGRVPVLVNAPGIVFSPDKPGYLNNSQLEIVLFLPVTYASQIHPGLPVRVTIGSGGLQFTETVKNVGPGIISPEDARSQYMLDSATSDAITQPSVAVTILPRAGFLGQYYAGSMVSAQIQVGWQRVLSLLPGINQLIGDR